MGQRRSLKSRGNVLVHRQDSFFSLPLLFESCVLLGKSIPRAQSKKIKNKFILLAAGGEARST